MLVDLEFNLEYASKKRIRHKNITQFDTSQGGLTMTTTVSGKPYQRGVAVRLGEGVYWAYDLDDTIKDYTKWEIDSDYAESTYRKMVKLSEGEEKNALRLEFSRLASVPYIGVADSVKQIFKVCHRTITSPNLYVIGLIIIEKSQEPTWQWTRSLGPYIGNKLIQGKQIKDQPNVDRVFVFNFYKLKPRT